MTLYNLCTLIVEYLRLIINGDVESKEGADIIRLKFCTYLGIRP